MKNDHNYDDDIFSRIYLEPIRATPAKVKYNGLNFEDLIEKTEQVSGFDASALLMYCASDFIREGTIMPPPLANYISLVLGKTATVSMETGMGKKRESVIINALNLKIPPELPAKKDPRYSFERRRTKAKLIFMHKKILEDKQKVGSAAKLAVLHFEHIHLIEKKIYKELMSIKGRPTKKQSTVWKNELLKLRKNHHLIDAEHVRLNDLLTSIEIKVKTYKDLYLSTKKPEIIRLYGENLEREKRLRDNSHLASYM